MKVRMGVERTGVRRGGDKRGVRGKGERREWLRMGNEG